MSRLVHYSLSFLADTPRPDIVEQFAISVCTLREHNAGVPVALFTWGGISDDLAAVCAEFDVLVHEQGSYAARLAMLCPSGWPALVRYPLLHKFLNFRELAHSGASQVLYCDCDTIFRADVEILFDEYRTGDIVAREEVHTSRSAYGVDRSFIDEPLLARLCAHEGAAAIPPFNLGVVLFNDSVVRRLAAAGLERMFCDYAWRFVCWMAMNRAGTHQAFGEFLGAAEASQLAGPVEASRALPFPSVNRWILDEVALWLTLGHVPGLRMADFDPRDVAQNGEYAARDPAAAGWVLCHYFSQNLRRIDAWRRNDYMAEPA